MNTIIEQRKQDWINLYDMNSAVKELLLVRYAENAPAPAFLWWDKMPEREEYAYLRYMRHMEDLELIPDSTLPFLHMLTGTEIFAEAFGCEVYRPLHNNPCAIPLIHDVSEFHKIKMPRLEDTNLTKLFDMADHLRARVGKDALLSLPDIQTPMDIAALIWDKNDFYAAMFDEESAIFDLSHMVMEFMCSFLDEWFKRYGSEFIAHYPDYYMPYGITVSEDEIGCVSTEMYDKFFRPELHRLAERYGAIGIHCCADSRRHWQGLREVPNLKLLNLNQDAQITRDAYTFFKNDVAQFHNTPLDMTELKADGKLHFVNMVSTDTRENAIAIAQAFREKQC